MRFGFFFGCILVVFLLKMESQEVILSGDFRSIGYFAIIMAILALSMSIYTYRDFKLKDMSSWPHSQGRIGEVRVEKGIFGFEKIFLTYNYRVNDREYTNDVYDFSQDYSTHSQLRMHPELRDIKNSRDFEGRLLKVYYNPNCPWRSAISKKIGQSVYVTSIPAIIVIVFCAYNLVKIACALL
jgi:hypothetical protein